MRPRDFGSDRRSVSVVVGSILLIGLLVVLVSLVGATILSGNYYDPSPKADLVYNEDADGTVAVVVKDVNHLPADDTEIRLRGEGHCTDWNGSGAVDEGDVTITAFDDCPDKLTRGDVIQIVGNRKLVDTYELRGVYPDYGCDEFESEVDSGSKITIESDERVACDFGSNGDRIDSEIEIKDGGTLIGDVFSNAQLKTDGGRLDGTFDSELDGTSYDIIDADIDGNLVSSDKISVKEGNSIGGSIDGEDEVDVDRHNDVAGSIVAEGDVWVRDASEVGGDVTVNGSGHTAYLYQDASVDGDVHASGNDVDLREDAVVRGDVTADTIHCSDGARIDGEDCEDYDG